MNGSTEKQSSWSRLVFNLLKITSCGAAIAAIAFGIAVFGSPSGVSESHADLVWFSSFERSNSDRFESALQRLGHDEPKSYTLNGNRVYFSATTSLKTPEELLYDYQEEFRRQGLNDRVYGAIRPHEESDRTLTGLTGGLVPMAISSERVLLGGMVTTNHARDAEALLQNAADAAEVSELFRGHRYVEIIRTPDRRHSSIVATWSDEDFDYGAMKPGNESARSDFDPEVPSCPGCTRLTRFAEDGHGSGRVDMAFAGPQGPYETLDFYRHAMAQRGWALSEIGSHMDHLEDLFDMELEEGVALTLVRDGQELVLVSTPDPATGHTLTVASRSGR